MSKKAEIPTVETCSKPTKKFILGRKYLIQETKKQMQNFKFQNFDGDYSEFLREQRKLQYKIEGYETDIKKALYMDSDKALNLV